MLHCAGLPGWVALPPMAAAARAASLWAADVAAPLSLAFKPDLRGPVLAVLDAGLFPFEDTPFTAERMTAVHGPAIDKIEEDLVETAAGAGATFRGLFTSGEFEAVGDAASFAIIEAVTYAVLPPRLAGCLVATAQWHDIARGDAIADQVRQLMDQMRVGPP